MNKLNYYLSALLAIAVLGFASCSKDDDPVITEQEGLLVADGYYITQDGVDPVATSQLKSENVEDDGFSTQPREGFFGNYVYLTAGDYVVVKVESKEVTETYGGAMTSATSDTKVCETLNYNVVEDAVVDGASFSVATEGLYRVTYDEMTSEILLIHVTNVGIIGSATSIGWGDTETVDIPGSVNASGGSWTASDITLREGEFKVRFNCAWFVDRRIDNTLTVDEGVWDASNGYMMWTNFGGSLDILTNGNDGPGIQVSAKDGTAPDEGVYTIDITWNATAGFDVDLTRTGDAEALPEFPEVMYLVGAGTAYGWDAPGTTDGAEMHKIAGGTDGVFWKILYLEAGQGFKISADNWAEPNLGHGQVDEFDANGVSVTDNGGNMDIATSGMYIVVLDLRDDMTKVSIMEPEVYGIGDAFGSWDEETHAFTVDNVNKTIVSPTTSGSTAAYRSYVDHAWIPSWWNAEFVVNGTDIEYRNDSDSDPTAVAVTAGQVITYSFDDNTGTIE